MVVTGKDNLSPVLQTYYDRKLLYRAKPTLAFYKAAQNESRSLGKRNGNVISYRRIEAMPFATNPLAEGVTPTAGTITRTEITATTVQLGNYVYLSDKLDMLDVDPIISEEMEVLGENAGQSVDAVIRATVVTGTNVAFQTGTLRSQQTRTAPITLNTIRLMVTNLLANNSRPFMGEMDEDGPGGSSGMFFGIIHPNVWHDLNNSVEARAVSVYSQPDKLYKFGFREFGGVYWRVTTMAPIFSGAGANGDNVYGTMIIGQGAFAAANIAGTGQFESIVKPLGSAGASDPLDQRSSLGWKSIQAPVILNNNFMGRIESGSSLN